MRRSALLSTQWCGGIEVRPGGNIASPVQSLEGAHDPVRNVSTVALPKEVCNSKRRAEWRMRCYYTIGVDLIERLYHSSTFTSRIMERVKTPSEAMVAQITIRTTATPGSERAHCRNYFDCSRIFLTYDKSAAYPGQPRRRGISRFDKSWITGRKLRSQDCTPHIGEDGSQGVAPVQQQLNIAE